MTHVSRARGGRLGASRDAGPSVRVTATGVLGCGLAGRNELVEDGEDDLLLLYYIPTHFVPPAGKGELQKK